jgi:hypothetical protein
LIRHVKLYESFADEICGLVLKGATVRAPEIIKEAR